MFDVGDKIVYPMHGAGIIESIEEKEILGFKQYYYIIKMPIGDMKVMIPIDNVDDIGIREIIDANEAEKVFELLKEDRIAVNNNWNKRYRENMEKLKDGSIYEIAQIAKSLMTRDKSLSTGERKLMINAKNAVLSEIMLAKNISLVQAENALNDSIYCDSDVEEE